MAMTHLDTERVDKLRAAAKTILGQSKEFGRFLKDVGKWAGPSDREQGPEQASLHNSGEKCAWRHVMESENHTACR